jgi:predicted nucleotidyltransferase component of viral defense system
MTVPERDPLRLHVEDPALFREAVAFTAAETRFAPRLVEKDYFSSVLLRHLAAADAGLVFRGGTCLAKVHARFYRLSEDLDFLVPTPVDASRAERSSCSRAAKRAVAAIAEALPGLRVVSPLRARTTAGSTPRRSPTRPSSARPETIKVELGLR